MHEINIAVVGTKGVGKSSFIQRVFDHRALPTLTVTPRKMSIDGQEHTVRLIELPFDSLDIDEGARRINWPETADSRPLPPIDGVLVLYDVMDKDSLRPIKPALGMSALRREYKRKQRRQAETEAKKNNSRRLQVQHALHPRRVQV
jgi:hypothetical protein